MTSPGPQKEYAAAYARLREQIARTGTAGEDTTVPQPLPSEMAIQSLWNSGLLGNEWLSSRYGRVRVLDFGTWNRSTGPDFLRAEVEINGQRVRGDIEIDPTAQDWENHGHGANPNFNQVILHVVLHPLPPGWYTRNSLHQEIPVIHLPAEDIRQALGKSVPLDTQATEYCRAPLQQMSVERVENLLKAAAAWRITRKRESFRRRAAAVGQSQAWYEVWAETLGYKVNKDAMQMLAQRAPLRLLKGRAESILFGTAGFLMPVLPQGVDVETRIYHRGVWDKWWPERDHFELGEGREIPWTFSPLRPLNHPHRRVAALALTVEKWKELEPLFNAEGAGLLAEKLSSLQHPYWDQHCTLPSHALTKRAALVGEERIQDFLVNHVYVCDESEPAWQTYLSLKGKQMSSRVKETAEHLFGDRKDVKGLLRHCYAQQALLQISTDFCHRNMCSECLFPSQLSAF